jgi:probable HAF family extracellular repeat protein
VSLSDLGSLGGNTAAYGINKDGIVVGYSFDATATRRAFLWQAGILTDLLGGAAIGDSAAWGIAGDFVYGQYTDDLGDTRAFRYSLSASLLTDLGSLGGNSVSALAGNALGQAVGVALNPFGEEQAFIYEPTAGLWNLNNLLVSNPEGVLLTSAQGINDAGSIVAVGLLPNGDQHTFYLTRATAPEASSLALILLIAPLYSRWSKSIENNS